jgi:hypothetical protein
MAQTNKRVLLSEYILDGKRLPAGSPVELNVDQLEKAAAAGVVYLDEERNARLKVGTPEKQDHPADVPANDPQGKVADETSGADLTRAQAGAKADKNKPARKKK